jgi:hypothetical protein
VIEMGMATTTAEREAVFPFWCSVYVEAMDLLDCGIPVY